MSEKATVASRTRARPSVAIGPPPSAGPGARARAATVTGDAHRTRRLRLAAAGDDTLQAIVDRLLLGPESAAEIASELGLDAQAVRHLLRRLVKGGLVARGEKSDRRGVSEFLYSCDPRLISLSSDDLSGLPAVQVERAVTRVLRRLFREAHTASQSGTYFAREEYSAIRFPLPLDEPGWRSAGRLGLRLADSIVEAREHAAGRISRGTEVVEATAAILFFETPGSPWPRPFPEGEPSAGQIRRRSNTRRVDAVLAQADPLRVKIVDALTLGPAAAVELAEEIGAPLERVRYELRALERAAMVKVHSRRERRGAMENVFLADNPRMTFSAADLVGGEEGAPRDFDTSWTRLVFGEAVEGVRNGCFGHRRQWQLGRTPLRLDPPGFAEVSAAMDATLGELFELREECLARRADGDRVAHPAFFDLLLFERVNPTFEHS